MNLFTLTTFGDLPLHGNKSSQSEITNGANTVRWNKTDHWLDFTKSSSLIHMAGSLQLITNFFRLGLNAIMVAYSYSLLFKPIC